MNRNFKKLILKKLNINRCNNLYYFNKYYYFNRTKELLKPLKDVKDIPDLKNFMNINTYKESNDTKKDFGISNLDFYENSKYLTEPQEHLDENKSQVEKTFYIKTYGCQMNESDSEIICSILEKNNFLKTENIENVNFFYS